MHTPRRTFLIAASLGAAALAAPTAAHATPTTCFADLPAPEGQAWQIKADGALKTRVAVGFDRAFAADHGQLRVDELAYTAVPNDPLSCDRTGDTLSFPVQKLNGFEVSRKVTALADGRLRWVDTIRNPTGQLEFAQVDFGLEIGTSQVAFETESGDATASQHDDWLILKDDGLFPFLQWGDDGQAQGSEGAFVKSGDLESWAPGFDDGDESARLHYQSVDVPAGETVRLVHVSGYATSAQTPIGQDAALFAGMKQAEAQAVVNWSPDVDGDGVGKSKDECPSVKGDLANGCQKLILNPDLPDAEPTPSPSPDPSPAPEQTPAPEGTPTPAGPQNPQNPQNSQNPQDTPNPQAPAEDKQAPRLKVSKLVKRISRARLTTKGLKPRLSCDESCTVTVRVKVSKRGAKKPSTVKLGKTSTTGTKGRSLTLKPTKKAMRRSVGKRLTLEFTARDAAGNKRVVKRSVRLA